MVASFLLLVLDFVSLLVHLDLWFVNRRQWHLFAPLLALIPEKQRKTYQGAYRQSLVRPYFCAQDKIDVSGTTFNVVFGFINAFSLIANLLASKPAPVADEAWLLPLIFGDWGNNLKWLFRRTLPRLVFWAHGVTYYIYLLYCLTMYRDARELCFYCKYGMYVGGLNLALGLLWV